MRGAKWLSVVAVCLLLAGCAGASSAETEGIRGRVVAPGGAPVAGAVVARQPIDPHRSMNLQAAVTDADGRYVWPLAPGVWEIEINAPGYLPARQRSSVTEGRWETLDFILQRA
jgi:Carboxypeptidase regulatory-like domain